MHSTKNSVEPRRWKRLFAFIVVSAGAALFALWIASLVFPNPAVQRARAGVEYLEKIGGKQLCDPGLLYSSDLIYFGSDAHIRYDFVVDYSPTLASNIADAFLKAGVKTYSDSTIYNPYEGIGGLFEAFSSSQLGRSNKLNKINKSEVITVTIVHNAGVTVDPCKILAPSLELEYGRQALVTIESDIYR